MIKVLFTCEHCGKEEKIDYDDMEEKNIVPVCDKCYKKFWDKRCSLVLSIKQLYNEFHIPVDTFNADELAE